MSFICMRIYYHFHINGFAHSFALKQRLEATLKNSLLNKMNLCHLLSWKSFLKQETAEQSASWEQRESLARMKTRDERNLHTLHSLHCYCKVNENYHVSILEIKPILSAKYSYRIYFPKPRPWHITFAVLRNLSLSWTPVYQPTALRVP